jgi:hypothetical protein
MVRQELVRGERQTSGQGFDKEFMIPCPDDCGFHLSFDDFGEHGSTVFEASLGDDWPPRAEVLGFPLTF